MGNERLARRVLDEREQQRAAMPARMRKALEKKEAAHPDSNPYPNPSPSPNPKPNPDPSAQELPELEASALPLSLGARVRYVASALLVYSYWYSLGHGVLPPDMLEDE